MTWAPGDPAQCVRAFDRYCGHCDKEHEAPQFMNVYEVAKVFLPSLFDIVLSGARPGPYLVLPGFRGAYWHENFRKVEPAPPEEEDLEEEHEREKEVVT